MFNLINAIRKTNLVCSVSWGKTYYVHERKKWVAVRNELHRNNVEINGRSTYTCAHALDFWYVLIVSVDTYVFFWRVSIYIPTSFSRPRPMQCADIAILQLVEIATQKASTRKCEKTKMITNRVREEAKFFLSAGGQMIRLLCIVFYYRSFHRFSHKSQLYAL